MHTFRGYPFGGRGLTAGWKAAPAVMGQCPGAMGMGARLGFLVWP